MKFAVFAALAVAFAIVVSGCTTIKSGGVAYDAESRTTIVTGKETTISPVAGPVRTLFLKAEISSGETGLYLVVLYLSVNGWLSADKVWDSDGHRLQGLRGSEESFHVKDGQVTKEIYYIPLTRRYLEAHRDSGINIRLQGEKGAVAAIQPGSFVGGFLTSLDATKKRLAGEVTVRELVPDHSKKLSRKPKVIQSN
jgi:hypothetical protein